MKSSDIYMIAMARSQRILDSLTDYNAPVLDPEDCLDVVSPAPVRRVQQCSDGQPRHTCMTGWGGYCEKCGRWVASGQTRRRFVQRTIALRLCANGCDWRLCE